ncbi:hypothetical protein Y1Q_0020538 [Alligator mississippiensis]|uniref:Uncharacterized protein n=1 Tax=Alligator mississippiensis TaxID=8496 RepID=A0A151P3V7_ALLMI|nr:hypothetical protein Y1Q_0020538 [Alligator mississippiensis]
MGRPWLVLLLALALLEAALAGHILQELLDRERGAAQDGDQAEDSLRERLGKEKAAAEEAVELKPRRHWVKPFHCGRRGCYSLFTGTPGQKDVLQGTAEPQSG